MTELMALKPTRRGVESILSLLTSKRRSD